MASAWRSADAVILFEMDFASALLQRRLDFQTIRSGP
jgi:hypothetical protein